jgi:hypothetical protein
MYFKNLRVLMSQIHEQKSAKGVDSMLTDLYDPILWRGLQCANACVRAQSCTIFLDAFPLQNPMEGHGRIEERLDRQLEMMRQLMADEDQRVRTVVSRGVCNALKNFWDAFPLQTIKSLLLFICSKLVRDAASVSTRIAALDGLGEILLNPSSHRVLMPLLKSLAFAIHDKSARVREAFIGVLQKVHSIEGYISHLRNRLL